MSAIARLGLAALLAEPVLALAQSFALDGSFEAGIAPHHERVSAAYEMIIAVETNSTRPGPAPPFTHAVESPGSSLDVITPVSPVPEPGKYALLLAGLGVVALVVLRRR